ncbi:hypothetical protein COCMIDRAFT_94044, partial [Bipolaris oryzae ATCC 44560]
NHDVFSISIPDPSETHIPHQLLFSCSSKKATQKSSSQKTGYTSPTNSIDRANREKTAESNMFAAEKKILRV